MATYKVLQDIEAEDKFFGPLTLKQCIFGAIAVVSAYLSVVFITRGIWLLSMPLVPVIIVTGFLAFPWGRDQPTETWLLAKIRFMFKPRKRIWDQSGMQELVKITAPPPVEQFTGDNLSQIEVKSRLEALANTIDSRGWVIKGSSLQEATAGVATDRLVDASTLPSVHNNDTDGEVDIFDTARAQQIDSAISNSSTQLKGRVMEKIDDTREAGLKTGLQAPADNLWFMGAPAAPGQSSFTTTQAPSISDDTGLSPLFSAAGSTIDPDDAGLLDNINSKRAASSHTLRNHRTINPYDPNAQKPATPPVTPTAMPGTIELARNNDRNVDSLAREAGNDEVVVSLH